LWLLATGYQSKRRAEGIKGVRMWLTVCVALMLVAGAAPVGGQASGLQADGPAGGPAAADWHVGLVGSWGGATWQSPSFQGDYAYVGVGLRLVILDITDPAAPVLVGQTPPLAGLARIVAVAGDYAYVADLRAGLSVVDVSDPGAPVEVGFYDTPGSPYSVAVAGDYAYVADWNCGLRVVDVSDPGAPVEVGFYDTPGSAYGVAVAGGLVYVADADAGLVILRYLPYQVYMPLMLRRD
jgi:hypothetical protein